MVLLGVADVCVGMNHTHTHQVNPFIDLGPLGGSSLELKRTRRRNVGEELLKGKLAGSEATPFEHVERG